jgi:hypothetical protein
MRQAFGLREHPARSRQSSSFSATTATSYVFKTSRHYTASRGKPVS